MAKRFGMERGRYRIYGVRWKFRPALPTPLCPLQIHRPAEFNTVEYCRHLFFFEH